MKNILLIFTIFLSFNSFSYETNLNDLNFKNLKYTNQTDFNKENFNKIIDFLSIENDKTFNIDFKHEGSSLSIAYDKKYRKDTYIQTISLSQLEMFYQNMELFKNKDIIYKNIDFLKVSILLEIEYIVRLKREIPIPIIDLISTNIFTDNDKFTSELVLEKINSIKKMQEAIFKQAIRIDEANSYIAYRTQVSQLNDSYKFCSISTPTELYKIVIQSKYSNKDNSSFYNISHRSFNSSILACD
jgi:hypothetical protein